MPHTASMTDSYGRSFKSGIAVRFLLFVLLAVSISVESAAAQDTPIIYLEWKEDPASSMVINWIASENSNRTLLYRAIGEDWNSINAAHNTIPGSNLRRFKADLKSLDDNTVFQFRVPGDSETYTFKTAPATAEEPVRFIVGSDVYSDSNNPETVRETRRTFAKMASHAVELDPLFVALGGDLAHAGSDPGSVSLWFDFLELWQENMVTETGRMIPMVIAIGNNEIEGNFGASPEDLVLINNLFSFPKEQWSATSFNHYGVLDFGDYLSLFILNTDHSNRMEGAQTNWLRNQLNNRRGVDHVFPVYHVSGWPTYRTFRGIREDAVRNNWHNLFYDSGIRFAFEHHDHIFKRTKPLGNCEEPITRSQEHCETTEKGVIYIGGGAWASPNDRSFRKDWHHEIVEKVHNFMLVEVTETYRRVTAINDEGQTITEETDFIRLSPPESFEIVVRTETSFNARWNEVEGIDRYLVDVAYDEDFENYVSGYENRSRNNNIIRMRDIRPNQAYFVRVRSENLFTRSSRSEVLKVVLPPEAPEIRQAGEINATEFTANWRPLKLGDPSSDYQPEYLLDVSYNAEFTNILPDYNGKNVGTENSFTVTGLTPGTTYYYRVKAAVEDQEGEFSESAELRTVGIDLVETTVTTDITRILANSDQISTMDIRVIGENGQPVSGVPIAIEQIGGEVSIVSEQERTDGNGELQVLISGAEEGNVTLHVMVSTIEIGDPITIEVQPYSEKVVIGNNFPNPFNIQTFIPITIPEDHTEVHLSIVNSAGAQIQTLLDREVMSAGYYEVPFTPQGLASGVYFARLITSDGVEIGKMSYTK